jgi:hypothetical protein
MNSGSFGLCDRDGMIVSLQIYRMTRATAVYAFELA